MNFIAAVQALVDGGADFVIIGGWSAILHGSSSVTNDLDIDPGQAGGGRAKDLQVLPELEGLLEAGEPE